MKYLKNIVNKKQVLTLSMIYIIWVVALFNFRIVKNFNFRFFVALLFGTISYAVTMSYILKFSKSVRETSEIQHLPWIYTLNYISISLFTNFLCGVFNIGIGWTLIINLITLFIYIQAIINVDKYIEKTVEKIEKFETKVENFNIIDQKMTYLLAKATDKDVKAKVLEIKQFFSYSNALSSDATRDIDAIIVDKIDKLVEAIENDKKEKVIKGLENLMTDIKYRNAIKSKNTAKER